MEEEQEMPRGNRSQPLLVVAMTAAVALASIAATTGASGGSATADERAAMQATQDACTAFRTGDLAAAERLLAPEFTLVNSDATIQSRADALAEIRAGDPRYERFENVDMTARIYGDVAMVRGVTRLRGVASGKAFEGEVLFTDLLERTATGWRLITSHVTRRAREDS
jgi:ketosteroid isomerase-like protein